MKNIISIILLLAFALSLTACGNTTEPKKITCEDIINAYEDAGYYVTHGAHKDESEDSQLCYVRVDLTEEPDSDYIYFTTYFTEEQAEEARKTDEYNLIIWFYASISGESRWLKTGTYGNIEYSYYNFELIKPFNKLVE